MGTIRKFDLQSYKDTFNLDYFVETGTFYGDGVEYANSFNFEHIYSYELYRPIFEEANKKFQGINHITILNEDSGSHLKTLCSKLDKNILFFLDAHFPGADARFTEYNDEKNENINLPLLSELKQIHERIGKYKDVIIIDDLRLFVDDNRIEAQPLNSHLQSIGKGHITRDDLVHFDLVEYLRNNYKDHFEVKMDFRDEGYLILEPK